ncbi:uncharacterized protein LOC121048850 [Rosa chinensis]|uniref:uncharacterized protein LOC121048850 n=1 Tax=Rosa chinensis TaxID=74649 RepID=UPI000D08AE48|nr:uncharacterized protein LOC121048850 [Rosa chinensis]
MAEQQSNDMNGNAGVILAIQDMASAIRQNNSGDHHDSNAEERVMRIQGAFRKAKPPIFKGTLDPMVAEEWLLQMKRSMNNQRIPDDLKVTIACTYLEGQAYHWWESVMTTSDTEILAWAAFEEIFLEKYFPDTVKQAKAKEFMFLSKGEMTVAEYQGKFEELMRFSPGIIPNEAAKAKKFEDGLNPEIREKVSILKLQKYSEVVDRALIAEQSIIGSKSTWKPMNLHEGYSDKHLKVNSHEYHGQQQARSFGVSHDPPLCYYCKEVGHIKRYCLPKISSIPNIASTKTTVSYSYTTSTKLAKTNC